MLDSKYCYPDFDVLINKFGIKDSVELFMAEKEVNAFFRISMSGQENKERLPAEKEIFFCRPALIQSYADSVFNNFP